MKSRIVGISVAALLCLLGTVALAALPAGAAEFPAHADFAGVWQGTLAAGDNELRLVFNVNETEDGELEATIDSPDQGATGIPVVAVKIEGDAIDLDVRVLNAAYTGRLEKEGNAIQGEWRQSGRVLPLKLKRIEDEPENR